MCTTCLLRKTSPAGKQREWPKMESGGGLWMIPGASLQEQG